jgi:hypothetical protein
VPSERPQPAPEPAPGQPSTISRPPSPTVRSPCFDFESSCAAARGAPRRQAPVTSFRFRIELRRDSVPQREERPATSPVVAACFASPDQASRPARPPARQQPIRNRNNETQRTIPRSANEDDRRPPTRPSTTDTTVDHRASTAERQPPSVSRRQHPRRIAACDQVLHVTQQARHPGRRPGHAPHHLCQSIRNRNNETQRMGQSHVGAPHRHTTAPHQPATPSGTSPTQPDRARPSPTQPDPARQGSSGRRRLG